jgi:pimeloyl-ACP methyl ester carboxylesterase
MDLYADPGVHCTDLRLAVIIDGVGHWVQQEAPAAVNTALRRFLQGLA